MEEKKSQRRLITDEVTIPAGERATLTTPRAEAGFLIASMSAPDSGLLFVALYREAAESTHGPRSLARRLIDWLCSEVPAQSSSPIYIAEEPEDFDDFLLSLIAPPNNENDCVEAGVTNFEGVELPVGTSAKLAQVHAGDRLRLDVFNPTDKPIVTKVTFAGPEAISAEPLSADVFQRLFESGHGTNVGTAHCGGTGYLDEKLPVDVTRPAVTRGTDDSGRRFVRIQCDLRLDAPHKDDPKGRLDFRGIFTVFERFSNCSDVFVVANNTDSGPGHDAFFRGNVAKFFNEGSLSANRLLDLVDLLRTGRVHCSGSYYGSFWVTLYGANP